jgi:hypothetical protein
MYGCAIRDTCKSLGLDCHIMSVAAADPIPPSSLYDQSMIFLRKEKPDIIIVVCAWANKIGTDERKLQNYLNGLLENCKCVILLTQPPQLPKHAGRAFIRANGDITFEEDSDVRLRRESSNALVLSMRSHVSGHIIVIDTAMEFISESGEIRYHDNSGKPYFHDRNHLNGTGANLLRPKIETAIKDFLAAESEQRNH